MVSSFDGTAGVAFACEAGSMTRYLCRTELKLGENPARCFRPEEYRAKDNRAEHAHLCGDCWSVLPPDQRDHYAKLSGLTAAQRTMLLLGMTPRGEMKPFK